MQTPVPSLGGRYVEVIPYPGGNCNISVLLLTWVHGEMLNQTEPDAERLIAGVGQVQSRLHGHARRWNRPEWFRRSLYGEATLLNSLPPMERGVEEGIIRADHYDLVSRASARIIDILRTTPKNQGTWGPIHMDWMGNLVVAGGTPVPIDFSLSGLGFYLQDVAQCICNIKKPLRQAYFEGYGKEFTNEELLHLSAFILMIIFITAGRNVFNPEWRDWMQTRRLPVIAKEFCPKLLAGEPFHLEI